MFTTEAVCVCVCVCVCASVWANAQSKHRRKSLRLLNKNFTVAAELTPDISPIKLNFNAKRRIY